MNSKTLSIFLERRGLDISAFSIFGLLFLSKPNTLIPTLILIAAIFSIVFDRMLRANWFSVIKEPTFRLISIPFIAWFSTSLFIALIHFDEAGLIFPSNAFRIGISSILLCFAVTKYSEKLFILGLVIASIASFSWGVFEIFEKNVRAQGTTNNPIHFGNITALIALICFSLAILSSKFSSNTKLILIFSTLLSISASVFSQTRSSAFVFFCIVPLFFIAKKNIFNTKVFGIACISFISIVFLLLTSTNIQKFARVDIIIHEISLNKSANHDAITGNRYEMWHSAWITIKQNPIIGLGPGKFQKNLEKHISSGEINSTDIFNQPHSDILHAASSGGIIKLTSYLSLMILPFYFFYKQYKINKSEENSMIWSVIGMQIISAYFLFGLTNSNFDLQIYSTTYAMIICVIAKLSLNRTNT